MKKALLFFLWVLVAVPMMAQQRQVTGKVTDTRDGTPLLGVTVTVKGARTGTATDVDGNFKINVNGNATLAFSFVGYETITMAIGEKSHVLVKMGPDSKTLNQVEISTGYGSKRRGAITGAITTVDGKQIESRPQGNLLHNLQGQAAGTYTMANGGRPGVAPVILLRGVGSINSGTAPLFIVDGQPVSASDFALIAPDDIENINILKDASATSIYGSRGANGVILVTMKRGTKNTRPQIDYRGFYGYADINRSKFKMMNTKDRLDYEVFIGKRKADDPEIPELMKTDFNQSKVVFKPSQTQSHVLSVKSGNETTSIYFSGEYFQMDGIYFDNTFKRYSSRLAIDNQTTKWLKTGVSMYLGYMDETTPNETRNSLQNPGMMAYLLMPYENLKNPDGSWKKMLQYQGYNGVRSQLWSRSLDLIGNSNDHLKFIGNAYAEANITKELKFTSRFGMNLSDYVTKTWNAPELAATDNGNATRRFSRWSNAIWTNLLNYRKTFGNHSINAVAGTEYNALTDYDFSTTARNTAFPTLYEFGAMSVPSTSSGSLSKYRMFSTLASVNYGYKDRYYADLSIRRDGSSKFGANNKWGNFWAVGLLWNAKKENFLKDNQLISDLRVRASVGLTGNDDIGFYPSYSINSVNNSSPNTTTTKAGYESKAGMVPTQASNPDLGWEKKRKFNVGTDLGLWDNRLTFTLDYYRELTYDMVLDVPVSYLTGYSSIKANMGKMQNNGIEFTVKSTVIDTKDITFNVTGNFTYNKNKVTELYGFRDELLGTGTGILVKVGYPRGQFKYNRFSRVNPDDGTEIWLDKNGKETTNFDGGDAAILDGKNMYAPYYGGATFDFNYKGIGIFMQWNYMLDKYSVNNTQAWLVWNNDAWYNTNRVADLYQNMWKKPGDIAKYPKYGSSTAFDDRYVENASFLRLRDLTIYYNLPKNLLSSTKAFRSARVYARGNNLLTFTKWSGYDPEYFNNLELGIYPVSRSYTLGLDLTF
ncbi:TonB-dependent receptor [Chitinophaga sp. G-6-1-13]|uniref:TonB-dependent receptor n=1 Tax=Chitinophaga fulva TaxID=2728842 RepID=A0A848GJ26_9BACT|nr:TonB-dependent receptor [Chitinophaga fulva]NML36720.1 TonB-dependent receptor [Chitinophaga fulva]